LHGRSQCAHPHAFLRDAEAAIIDIIAPDLETRTLGSAQGASGAMIAIYNGII
jgi:hypothetical protein